MRGFWVLLLIPFPGVAQQPAASVSGVLLERDTVSTGQFSVRVSDNQVFRFQYDGLTAVERSGMKMDVPALRPGETVEVLCEPVEGSLVRAARSVRVLIPVTPPMRAVAAVTPVGRVFSSTDLAFAGVVSKFSPQVLVIRGRDGDHTFLIRKDTRYLADGSAVEADALRTNMRVYVVAGKDLYERVEAYRIVWGSILAPGR